ncbi:MAG: serine/threonine-protein kinase [Pirellulaceae bacterium]|nr:serine/threonine-protein kinase [Pirellulaceae bacterium]
MSTSEGQPSDETRVETTIDPRQPSDRSGYRQEVDRLNAEADKSGFLDESLAFWDALQRMKLDQRPTTDLAEDTPAVTPVIASDGIVPERAWVGPYQIEEQIGVGGFSRIYAARHRLRPESVVALKLFRHLRLDSWQRLHVESLVLSKFDHPNLVTVLDAGELSDGCPYLVMNRVLGVSLDKHLHQQQRSYQEIAQLFQQIALAVQHAHDRDVVHRDLKPTNIMVQADGQPVVIDFGLAKRLNLSELEQSLTASHAVVGTLGYLAPEQAETKKQEITRAVDVYGLGATLYFALTGRPPLDRSDFLQAIKDLKSKSPELPSRLNTEVPRDLELICLKCLEKVPGDRYPSLQQVADDMERFVAGRSVLARPAGWLQRQVRWCQANPLVAGLAGLLLVTLTVGLIATVALWRQANDRWQLSQTVLAQAEEILRTGANSAETMLVQTPGALEYRHQQLKDSLAFRQRLNTLIDANQVKQRSVAVTHFLLGKICCRRGLFEEAHENYAAALLGLRALLKENPRNERLRFDLFHSLLGIDQTATTLRLDSAIETGYLREALELIEGLVAEFPANKSYRDALACNLLILGGRVGENPESAQRYIQQAYHEALKLRQELPTPCLEWRHVGTAANAMTEICLNAQKLDEAESWALLAQEATEGFLQRPDGDPGEIMDLANCLFSRHRIAKQRGDLLMAETWGLKWRALLVESANTHPDYFVFSDILARADELLAHEKPQKD